MQKKILESVKNTLTLESEALLEVRDSYDEAALERVLEAIVNCPGKVVVAGCGTSGTAAKKIAHTLCCICCPAIQLVPSEAAHGGLGVIREGDIVILLSKGGHTQEINSLIAPAHEKKAMVVGVGENEASQLAQQSDCFLKVKISREPDDFDMLATSSTLSVIALFDAIAIAIVRTRGYTREQFAVIHPGGDVGERLAKATRAKE